MNRFLIRAARDRKGVAAIEFALIFPLIFLLNIAAAEALMVYEAQRNVSHIAATMADITAQSRTVTPAELSDILSASTSMIHPFPKLSLQQRISSLSKDDAGAVKQDWSVNRDYTAGGSASAPSGYLAVGESVIVTDVIYDYRPTFGIFLPETLRFTRHAYARPRLSVKVEKVS